MPPGDEERHVREMCERENEREKREKEKGESNQIWRNVKVQISNVPRNDPSAQLSFFRRRWRRMVTLRSVDGRQ